MTMSKENQNKISVDEQLILVDYFGLFIAALVAMVIVWLTLNIPEARKKQAEKYCYHYCELETNKKMTGEFTSGSRYITHLKVCYQDCIKEQNKVKDEKNTNKDTSD